MKKENTDKLTDKAFMRLIITSALAIFLCVVCLCSTTWAWFSDSNTSGSNSITASSCTMVITVGDQQYAYGTTIPEITLPAGNTLTVKMTIPEDSASGYCVVEYTYTVDGETKKEECRTQAVSNTATSTPVREVSFSIVAEEDAQTKVKITPRWGIYSGVACIKNGDVLNVTTGSITPADELTVSETVEETETTTIETDTEESIVDPA